MPWYVSVGEGERDWRWMGSIRTYANSFVAFVGDIALLGQDLDGSGKIRYTEFLAATIEAQGAISEERLAEAFDRLDSDDSGFISPENLIEILGPDFPREEIDEIIAESKLQKDNQIRLGIINSNRCLVRLSHYLGMIPI